MRGLATLFTAVLSMAMFPSVASAEHVADGLVLSEVGYDTITESSAASSAEYIEIYNPTGAAIPLTRPIGSPSIYLSDAPTQYFKLPAGAVSVGNNADFLWQFPENATIPAHSFLVVCADSTTFLNEFYGGSLATFLALPGSPQLFEATQDGTADFVPGMINKSTAPTSAILTNGGETVVLFAWDGVSDLVKDLDIVVWVQAGQATNKTGQAVDGPDADTVASTYADDAAQTTSLAPAAPTGPNAGLFGLARSQRHEIAEVDSGGNGASGHDETSELFGAGSAWLYQRHSPGLPSLTVDTSATDAISFLPAAAISSADGPGSGPADLGADGTLTELYLASADMDGDRQPESLYMAVRGDLFGDPDGDASAAFVLIDVDPPASTGATQLSGPGVDLADTTGALDTRLTSSGFVLDPSIAAVGGGFDAALGLDGSVIDADGAGWRGFGTGGASGAFDDFAVISGQLGYGLIGTLYPGAPGTSHAAPDAFEATVSLAALSSMPVTYVRVVVVATGDAAAAPSPNTLPESDGDDFTAPHVLTRALCYDVAAGRVVQYFVDADGDGFGGSTPSPYCGPQIDGVALAADDCDDLDDAVHPGAAELCNGEDDDCDGQVPANEADADADLVRVCAGDCDDTDPAVHPGAIEVCDLAITDEDCDGAADDADDGVTGTTSFFVDADGDGFGDPLAPVQACRAVPGRVLDASDCDDTAAASHPGATEICDGLDNDCVGGLPADEADADADDVTVCGGDCDDVDPSVHPGATEACDGKDNDCSGTVPAGESDGDADGVRQCAGDCNDADPVVHPGAIEACDPADLDEDCDALADDADTVAAGKIAFFTDVDGDGFGNGAPELRCDPSGTRRATVAGDCNDAAAGVNPGATEVCDPANVDEDCDALADDLDDSATGKVGFFTDADNDGFGIGAAIDRCDAFGTVRATVGGDCDDAAAGVHPGAAEQCNGVDDDCTGGVPASEADADGDLVRACAGDCNDADPAVHPGAAEACNGVDDDCTAGVPASEADADADGVRVCAGDCNDASATIKPGAPEICDGKDDDCNGQVPADEADNDNDGARVCGGDCNDNAAGIHPGATEICNGTDDNCDGSLPAGEADADGDGSRVCSGDCNDGSGTVHPGASETCNSTDDDCDGMVDENAVDAASFFADADTDGFGNPAVSQKACSAPTGFVADATDCNDGSAAVHPGATEVCNLIDDDCDAATDEGTQVAFYRDVDGDTYGGDVAVFGCSAPAGFVDRTGDCNDNLPAVHPGALEMCNGADDDCAGGVPADEVDADADGVRVCGNDCNDADPAIHPGLPDIPGDGIDQDCAGGDATGGDADGDGYTDVTDCNDTDPAIHPEADEACDGVDTDCDPNTDEDFDDDEDGFSLCMDDCALADPAVNPGATEVCNDVDDDCDGTADEGFTHDGDGDGADGTTCGGDDCDDGNAAVHPGATDIPGDGTDQDCDGADGTCVPTATTDTCGNGLDDDCDGATDGADSDCGAPMEDDGDGGCGCRVGGSEGGAGRVPAGAAVMLLVVGLALRRRRRRARGVTW